MKRITPLLLLLLTISLFAIGQNEVVEETSNTARNVSRGGGIGLGTIIALILSWRKHHSFLWLIVHGLLGWLYVIYYIIFGRTKD